MSDMYRDKKNLNQFFVQMLDNLHQDARNRGRSGYFAQTVGSCLSIYALCVLAKPDIIIDVGTAAGASCLALALAAHDIGLPLSSLVTIGNRMNRWYDTAIPFQSNLARENGLELGHIRTVEANFNDLNPDEFILPDKSVMLFYDIHNSKEPGVPQSSPTLINEWLPLIYRGIVAVHDIYTDRALWRPHYSSSSAKHWDGRTFWGYGECADIVEWINITRGQLLKILGEPMVWFRVVNGIAI